MKRHGYQINAKADRAEILIYEDIGEGWLGGISAKRFVEDLNGLNVGEINLRINSDGGSVFEGLTIYNALKRKDANINVAVDGLAASIASIIAMSGNEISMAANAFMMIHDPWTVSAGTAEDLRKTADLMDSVRENLLNVYVDRTRGEADNISTMMAAETWMTADQAMENGFIDSITDELRIAARVDQSKYRHVPEELLSRGTPNTDDCEEDNAHMDMALRRMKLKTLSAV